MPAFVSNAVQTQSPCVRPRQRCRRASVNAASGRAVMSSGLGRDERGVRPWRSAVGVADRMVSLCARTPADPPCRWPRGLRSSSSGRCLYSLPGVGGPRLRDAPKRRGVRRPSKRRRLCAIKGSGSSAPVALYCCDPGLAHPGSSCSFSTTGAASRSRRPQLHSLPPRRSQSRSQRSPAAGQPDRMRAASALRRLLFRDRSRGGCPFSRSCAGAACASRSSLVVSRRRSRCRGTGFCVHRRCRACRSCARSGRRSDSSRSGSQSPAPSRHRTRARGDRRRALRGGSEFALSGDAAAGRRGGVLASLRTRDDAPVRLLARLEELYAIGGGARLGYSAEEDAAHELADRWMREAGLEVGVATRRATSSGIAGTPWVWSGSHLDTVPNGGVSTARSVLLRRSRPLTACATPPLGRGLPSGPKSRADGEPSARGASYALSLKSTSSRDRCSSASESRSGSSPASQARRGAAVTFEGRAAHAGTTPMQERADALVEAARFVSASRGSARARRGSRPSARSRSSRERRTSSPERVTASRSTRARADGRWRSRS